MASNNSNDKRKLEEEVESSTARKRLWLSDNDDHLAVVGATHPRKS
jgi:hypothetical protein